MYLKYYLERLGYINIPLFLEGYLNTPSLLRLKKIGYFCGMDYASNDIYNFREKITRYDHSLTVCLLTYKLTKDKKTSLAGLFHDIATPCFSHVIDYMNKDYERQESTEEYTEKILKKDNYLLKKLVKDKIDIEDIIDFKKYTIVDNDRPKLCVDRMDGVILTDIGWTKCLTKEDIDKILNDIDIFKNEDNELEIGFKTIDIARKVVDVSSMIDKNCHSNYDNYMMELLAQITKISIEKGYITYEDLYLLNEEELFNILENIDELKELIKRFRTIKLNDIESIDLPKVKKRDLNPLVKSKRCKRNSF